MIKEEKENNVYRGFIGHDNVIFMKRINEDDIYITTYRSGYSGLSSCVVERSNAEEFFGLLFRAVIDIMHGTGQEIQKAGFLDSNGDVLYKVFVRIPSRTITVQIGDYEFTLYMGDYNPGTQIGKDGFDNECIFKDVQSIVDWLRNSEKDE